MATTMATPTTEDGDLLHAVMAFLEENDAVDIMGETSDSYGSSQSDAESRSDHQSPTKTPMATPEFSGVLPPLQPRRPKINRSRQRMREELVMLREQVLELQERLETLQGGVASRVGIFPKREVDIESRKLRAMAWQALAEHESVKKQEAENEREKLKALLKEQKLAFRRLRRYLGKYSAESQWAGLKKELVIDGDASDGSEENVFSPESQLQTEPAAKPYSTAAMIKSTTKEDFHELSRMIPTMYLQTGAMFKDERLAGLTSSLRELKVQNELTPKMSIEALDSRVVPFDYEHTARAVWEFHLTKVKRISGEEDKIFDVTEDSIRRVFCAAIRSGGFDNAMSRVRMETRRFIEHNRVVIVQSSIFDQMHVDEKPIPGFGLRQFQWTVIGPPRNFFLRNSGRAMSQVEVFEVTVPVMEHVSGVERGALLQRVRNLCSETANVHMELERESVESILMDTVLEQSGLKPSMLVTPDIQLPVM